MSSPDNDECVMEKQNIVFFDIFSRVAPKACICSSIASGTFGKDCHSSPTLEYGTKQSTSPSTRMPNNGKIRNVGTRCNCI